MAYKKDANQNQVPRYYFRYTFDFFHRKKRFRKKVVCTPSQVSTIYREWEQDCLGYREAERVSGNVMLFDNFDEYLKFVKNTKSANAFDIESRSITLFKQFFGDMPILEFKRYHVEDFSIWRKTHPMKSFMKEVSEATINRDLITLSSFFSYCITREYYTRINPCYKMRRKQDNVREIRLTVEQIQELLDKARSSNERLTTAIYLALLTGMRRGEIITLKWSDIDFTTSLIHLSAQVTKNNKRRVICMPDPLEEYLKELRKINPFEELVMGGWTKCSLRYHFIKLRNSLSFSPLSNGLDLHFHDLRHVYAQSLRDAGVSLDDIQVLLGHSSVTITEQRYAQFGGANAKEKVNLIQTVIPFKRSAV